jgi:hypothetical protein
VVRVLEIRRLAVPLVLLAALAALSLTAARAAPTAPARAASGDAIADAESAFVDGRFDEAERGFANVLARAPRDTLALLRSGQIALLSNRLAEAQSLLARAREAGASPARTAGLLGEIAYRRDDYGSAAEQFRLAGHEAKAKKLESFGAVRPWRIEGPAIASVPMVQVDPLPLVEARVNGRGPYFFLIDTGGGELILDPALADSIGAPRFGEEMGTFGGGKQRAVVHSRLDRLDLGDVSIRDIPIGLLDTARLSGAALGRRVAGIIGTIVLDHFRATLDYPGARLVLARRDSPDTARAGRRIEVPFWMAGDHYVLARGSVDSSATQTWFVDTGLAGAAFTAPASTLRAGGIAVPDTTNALSGQGGGGAVRFSMFHVHRLSLGAAEKTELLGFYGPFPPSLERAHGVRIAGIVSHAFLRDWRVTFDFERMQMLLDSPE